MAAEPHNLSWFDVQAAAQRVAERHQRARVVAGVPRGGLIPAALVATTLDAQLIDLGDLEEAGHDNVLVVDDLVDSGTTAQRLLDQGVRFFDALYRKPHTPATFAASAIEYDAWLVFPWERAANEQPAEDAVVRLLEAVGEDPNREGLRETPARVVRALREMTAGVNDDPAVILAQTFESDRYDEMVVLREIEFTSLCEHHLLPFTGTADVGYVANGRVVGLSKLARLVECYARRPQLQERMTADIAYALNDVLAPLGVGVIVRAHHACMACRGVRKPNAEMVTSTLLGYMRVSETARAEFLRLAGH